ncbi:hypothetical protein HaLaN_13449 [Haematococcus lacustris]|uniref:Uncharacterized protein n=1 Tax=Haematococcus lacustris TaxID=44745 RepID=A0A699ZD69_HAELA|nr:hypothetical protein HaLaN_13449 [Haematococcus lacustris]
MPSDRDHYYRLIRGETSSPTQSSLPHPNWLHPGFCHRVPLAIIASALAVALATSQATPKNATSQAIVPNSFYKLPLALMMLSGSNHCYKLRRRLHAAGEQLKTVASGFEWWCGLPVSLVGRDGGGGWANQGGKLWCRNWSLTGWARLCVGGGGLHGNG